MSSKKSDQAAGTLDLDAIEQRAASATAGPWKAYGGWIAVDTGHAIGDPDAPDTRLAEASPSDAWFIAHARQDVPALCAEVRRLRALCEQGTSVSAPETYDDASCG